MLHTNAAELRLLFDTFTRVWTSGGQANLSLQTKDSQVDLQLGPADGRRPGPPDAGRRSGAEPWTLQGQPLHPQARRRGPAARARDACRRQDWLAKRQDKVQEQPEIQTAQEETEPVSRPELEDQEIILNSTTSKTEPEIPASNVIPQLDGAAVTALGEKPEKDANAKEKEKPVIFKMMENGFAETRLISPGEKPPALVYHQELGMGREPRQTEWKHKVWIEYVFEVDDVQMEMYQVV